MSYDTNPFYSPDTFDSPLVLEASTSLSDEAYQFEYLAVWSLKANPTMFYTASDSGCSCPTPFEDFHTLADLTPVGNYRLTREPVEGEYEYQYYLRAKERGDSPNPWLIQTQESWDSLRERARNALPSAQDSFYGTPPQESEVEDFCKVLDGLERRNGDAHNDPTVPR